MNTGHFWLGTKCYDIFNRNNVPTDEIIRKITHELSASGVQTEVCTILSRRIWHREISSLNCDKFLRWAFSSGGEQPFLHDLIYNYNDHKRTTDVDVKTDFHLRLLIRQIAVVTIRIGGDTDMVKEFLRSCPGFTDTIDYKYYIGDVLPLRNWRRVLRKIARRSNVAIKWLYYMPNRDPCELFDYVTVRYVINEVAKAMVETSIDIYNYDYVRLFDLDPDEAKIAKKFYDDVTIAIENIKHNFAETSNCAEWRASMQRRIEKLERKIEELLANTSR